MTMMEIFRWEMDRLPLPGPTMLLNESRTRHFNNFWTACTRLMVRQWTSRQVMPRPMILPKSLTLMMIFPISPPTCPIKVIIPPPVSKTLPTLIWPALLFLEQISSIIHMSELFIQMGFTIWLWSAASAMVLTHCRWTLWHAGSCQQVLPQFEPYSRPNSWTHFVWRISNSRHLHINFTSYYAD